MSGERKPFEFWYEEAVGLNPGMKAILFVVCRTHKNKGQKMRKNITNVETIDYLTSEAIQWRDFSTIIRGQLTCQHSDKSTFTGTIFS